MAKIKLNGPASFDLSTTPGILSKTVSGDRVIVEVDEAAVPENLFGHGFHVAKEVVHQTVTEE